MNVELQWQQRKKIEISYTEWEMEGDLIARNNKRVWLFHGLLENRVTQKPGTQDLPNFIPDIVGICWFSVISL